MALYLTKYALSDSGAQLVEIDERFSAHASDGWVYLQGYMSGFKLGRDVFEGRAAAVKAVEAMRQKKIASVAKQLAALHRMHPEEMVPPEATESQPSCDSLKEQS
jgi:hypothetical protein